MNIIRCHNITNRGLVERVNTYLEFSFVENFDCVIGNEIAESRHKRIKLLMNSF